MLRAVWGERRRDALLRVAADRRLRVVERGSLAVAGHALDLASSGEACCVFSGRLVGVEPGACAQALVERYARDGLAALTQFEGGYVAFIVDGPRAWAARDWVRLEHGAIVVLNVAMLRELAEAGSEQDG